MMSWFICKKFQLWAPFSWVVIRWCCWLNARSFFPIHRCFSCRTPFFEQNCQQRYSTAVSVRRSRQRSGSSMQRCKYPLHVWCYPIVYICFFNIYIYTSMNSFFFGLWFVTFAVGCPILDTENGSQSIGFGMEFRHVCTYDISLYGPVAGKNWPRVFWGTGNGSWKRGGRGGRERAVDGCHGARFVIAIFGMQGCEVK